MKRLFPGTLAILAGIALASCMISPLDEQTVEYDQSKKKKPVQFAGAVPFPDQPVTIEVQHPKSKQWTDIHTTTSTQSTIFDPPMYLWSAWVEIADTYFGFKQCAVEGKVARVRSITPMKKVVDPKLGFQKKVLETTPLMSFRDDINQCLYQGKKITDCAAPQTPVVRLVDGVNFGKECVERINMARGAEGLDPLERHEQEECCADGNAKYNSEHGSHAKACSSPQNECPGYASVAKLLDDCIWQQQYLDEKKCYEDHYPDCTNWPIDANQDGIPDETPCKTSLPPFDPIGCAHYVHMINPSLKKVACGFHKTPKGVYWSEQNFYK